MKKILIVSLFSLLMVSGVFAQANNRLPGGYVIARNFDPKSNTSATLTNVTGQISNTTHMVVVVDNGAWTITTNVTFGTNTTVWLMDNAWFNISTSIVVTINGGFVHGDFPAFTGDGTAAGSASFDFRYPGWGSTSKYDIGRGVLPEAVTNLYFELGPGWHGLLPVILTSNDLQRFGGTILEMTNLVDQGSFVLSTNQYGAPIVTTNILAAQMLIAYPDLQTNLNLNSGPIRDCWVNYVDTNTITIGLGSGDNAGSFFAVTTVVTQDIAALADVTNLYVYLSNTSTFPSTLTFYDSVVLPEWSDVYHANYHTNGVDRFIGSIPLMGNIVVTNFSRSIEGSLMLTNQIALGSSMDPDGTWQTPDDSESSLYLPATATRIFVRMANTDATPGDVDLGARRFESHGGADLDHSGWSDGGSVTVVETAWVRLGASRNIRIKGENNNDNNLNTWFMGYEEAR